MKDWVELLLVGVGAVGASSGFWAYLQKRDSNKNAVLRLVLGLAHDRIVFLGMSYVKRGYVTADEYEDLDKYLYGPYSEFGGNGLAQKIMESVGKLPMIPHPIVSHSTELEVME